MIKKLVITISVTIIYIASILYTMFCVMDYGVEIPKKGAFDFSWEITKTITAYIVKQEENPNEYRLILVGTGDMPDYDLKDHKAVWHTWKDANGNAYNENVTSLEISTKITSIGDYAFANFFKIKTVSISNKVSHIGKYSFLSCTQLETVNMPSKMKSIGMGAFMRCKNLTSIKIPHGVKSINEMTFAQCMVLNTIYIPDTVLAFGPSAFVWTYLDNAESNIYYGGSSNEWNNISVCEGSDDITKAQIHYDSRF